MPPTTRPSRPCPSSFSYFFHYISSSHCVALIVIIFVLPLSSVLSLLSSTLTYNCPSFTVIVTSITHRHHVSIVATSILTHSLPSLRPPPSPPPQTPLLSLQFISSPHFSNTNLSPFPSSQRPSDVNQENIIAY